MKSVNNPCVFSSPSRVLECRVVACRVTRCKRGKWANNTPPKKEKRLEEAKQKCFRIHFAFDSETVRCIDNSVPKLLVILEEGKKQHHHKSTLDDDVYSSVARRSQLAPPTPTLNIVSTFNAEFISTRICSRPLVDSPKPDAKYTIHCWIGCLFSFYCILYAIRNPKWKFNFETMARLHLALGRNGAQCAKRYHPNGQQIAISITYIGYIWQCNGM